MFIDGDRFGRGRPAIEYNYLDPTRSSASRCPRAASSLYGSDAMNGVVNFITRRGTGDSFPRGWPRSASAAPTRWWRRAASSRGSAKPSDALIGVNYRTAEDYETPRGKVKNTDFDTRSLNARFGYSPDSPGASRSAAGSASTRPAAPARLRRRGSASARSRSRSSRCASATRRPGRLLGLRLRPALRPRGQHLHPQRQPQRRQRQRRDPRHLGDRSDGCRRQAAGALAVAATCSTTEWTTTTRTCRASRTRCGPSTPPVAKSRSARERNECAPSSRARSGSSPTTTGTRRRAGPPRSARATTWCARRSRPGRRSARPPRSLPRSRANCPATTRR